MIRAALLSVHRSPGSQHLFGHRGLKPVVGYSVHAAGTLAVLLISAAALIAQSAPGRLYRSAIDVTAVGVTVRDRDGQLVRNLQRDAFDLFEDGRLQTVTQFTNERVPM